MRHLTIMLLGLAFVACAKGDPGTRTTINGDHNTVLVGTGGSGVGSAPCAGNATGSADPGRGQSSTSTVSGTTAPDCSTTTDDHSTQAAQALGSGFLPTQ